MASCAAVDPRRVRGSTLARLLPAPGERPSEAQCEAGFVDIPLLGVHPNDPAKNLLALVTGDRDPGYGSPAGMLGESAVCLDRDALELGGRFWTPASTLAEPLLEHLQARAGLRLGGRGRERGPDGAPSRCVAAAVHSSGRRRRRAFAKPPSRPIASRREAAMALRWMCPVSRGLWRSSRAAC